MITQVMRPVYVTKDGAEFADLAAAQKHELALFLSESDIYWRDTDANEVANVICNNWDTIKAAMGERDD